MTTTTMTATTLKPPVLSCPNAEKFSHLIWRKADKSKGEDKDETCGYALSFVKKYWDTIKDDASRRGELKRFFSFCCYDGASQNVLEQM